MFAEIICIVDLKWSVQKNDLSEVTGKKICWEN